MSYPPPHPFDQDPAANGAIYVCLCGKWPLHHVHTGDPAGCTCDSCHAVAEDRR